jgi:hypothetical protein
VVPRVTAVDRPVTCATVGEFLTSLATSDQRVDQQTGARVTVERVTDSNRLGAEVAAVAYIALFPDSEIGARLDAYVASQVEPWVNLVDKSDPSLNGHVSELVASALNAFLDDALQSLDRIAIPDPSPALVAAVDSNDNVRLIGFPSANPLIVMR